MREPGTQNHTTSSTITEWCAYAMTGVAQVRRDVHTCIYISLDQKCVLFCEGIPASELTGSLLAP